MAALLSLPSPTYRDRVGNDVIAEHLDNFHKIKCPACDGSGRQRYELVPNHPSGRMGSEDCSACGSSGEIIDLSKCHFCNHGLTGDADDGLFPIEVKHGGYRDVAICGPCNRGEDVIEEAA